MTGASKPSPAPIIYEVSPELRDGRLQALEVTLRLRASPEGEARLNLPNGEAGATELWRNLRDFEVQGATSVTAPTPAQRVIKAAPGAPLTVRYRVVSAFDHDPLVSELETYSPLIRPTRFWVYGEALFVTPKDASGSAVFRWTRAPAGFGFASDLEHAAGRPMPIADLTESVLVGGSDLAVVRRDLAGAPLRVAVLGHFDFPTDAFVDMAAKTIATERGFWAVREGPFMVALAPLVAVPGRTSTRGEGRGDAFAIQGGADTPLSFLKSTLAHEYFHTWNPARLGGMHDGDAERADYWFSEGFTDFYARRLALRSGVFNLDEFVADWNATLSAYAASPLRTAPNARVVTDFWKNYDAQKLPYQRGALLAAAWDQALRARSGGRIGMDDVVKAMRVRAIKLGPRSPKSPQLFIDTVQGFGIDVRDDVARIVEMGGPVLLPADAFGGCLTVTTKQVASFESGYEAGDRNGQRVFTKVKPSSAAYSAGLREGMIYVRRESGQPGDSEQPFRLRVKDGEVERLIEFLPAGEGTVTLQRVQAPKGLDAAAHEACAKAVAAVA